jgi:hypothetical protein
MERLEDGRIAFRGQHRLIDLWLRLKKEPFRWGIRKEALPGFLRERGFECLEVATHREFRERYLTTPEGQGLPLVDGDHLCLARAGGTMYASPR